LGKYPSINAIMSFQLRALSLPLQIFMSQLCAMKDITTMPYLSFQNFWQNVHYSCKICAFLFDKFLNILYGISGESI
jgi:hypothetical protein